MALKPCRECKKKVSTEATVCPSCGAPDPTRVLPLKKGENIELIEPMTEDLQYLISWFSVKSERGHHLFI